MQQNERKREQKELYTFPLARRARPKYRRAQTEQSQPRHIICP